MGGRKKRSGGGSAPQAAEVAQQQTVPTPEPIVKAGETVGGTGYGDGVLSGAKRKTDKKGTLAQGELVGVLSQAVDTLGK